MRSSGRSATSGSRLFMSMRRAASCGQPLQLIAGPRGARMMRVPTVMTTRSLNVEGDRRLRKDQKVRSVRAVVNEFQKKVSVDFHCACAFKFAAVDHRCHG